MNQVLVFSEAAACIGFILDKCLSESTIVVVDFISDLMQQQPVFDCTPESSGGPSTRIPLWQNEGDNCVKNIEEGVKTTSARGERITKDLSNPSFGNKKENSDSISASKSRVIKKTTTRRLRSCKSANEVAGTDNMVVEKAIILVCMTGVTPVKRHVAERRVPPSPFDLNLNPRTKSITFIEKMFQHFVEEEYAVLNRVWFRHDEPWTLSLTGRQLWVAFAKSVLINTETFDAIIRLLQEEDIMMYKDCCCEHQQWRHLLPPCFSEFVLANGEGTYSEQIKELFLGSHLGSNAEHCRLIMLPCAQAGHWSLYAWDVEKKRIHVLDPVLCQKTREEQRAVHGDLIASLHSKLFDYFSELFSGLHDDRAGYKITFYNLAHAPALREESTFYVVHYIKWFDGERLTFTINERKAKNARMSIFYNLMQMAANQGWKPKYLDVDVETK